MTHDVFISYSNSDRATADTVCATLERTGIRCWIAPRDIMPGSTWGAAIADAIDECRAFVLIFSSSANNSQQIRREVERAVNNGVPVVPVRIEKVAPTSSLAYLLGAVHWFDALTPPLELHFDQLAKSVRALLAHTSEPLRSGAAYGAPASAAPYPGEPVEVYGRKRLTLPVGGPDYSARRRLNVFGAVGAVVGGAASAVGMVVGGTVAVAGAIVGGAVIASGAAVKGAARLGKKLLSAHPDFPAADGAELAGAEDIAQCSVFAPPKAPPARKILVQVYLHPPQQAEEVERDATRADDATSKRDHVTLPIKPNSRVDIVLEEPDLEIAEPHQSMIWRGRSVSAKFVVRIPAAAGTADFFPIVRVSIDGKPYGRLGFKLSSDPHADRMERVATELSPLRYRRAFCSYSSEDAEVVTRCVQLLTALGYDCFHDKSSLRPAQEFEPALQNEVLTRELFLLFWSYAAQRSDWVRKETEWAFKAQCDSATKTPDILPIILDGPPAPKPYEFLKERHFDDRFQYMVAALKSRPQATAH